MFQKETWTEHFRDFVKKLSEKQELTLFTTPMDTFISHGYKTHFVTYKNKTGFLNQCGVVFKANPIKKQNFLNIEPQSFCANCFEDFLKEEALILYAELKKYYEYTSIIKKLKENSLKTTEEILAGVFLLKKTVKNTAERTQFLEGRPLVFNDKKLFLHDKPSLFSEKEIIEEFKNDINLIKKRISLNSLTDLLENYLLFSVKSHGFISRDRWLKQLISDTKTLKSSQIQNTFNDKQASVRAIISMLPTTAVEETKLERNPVAIDLAFSNIENNTLLTASFKELAETNLKKPYYELKDFLKAADLFGLTKDEMNQYGLVLTEKFNQHAQLVMEEISSRKQQIIYVDNYWKIINPSMLDIVLLLYPAYLEDNTKNNSAGIVVIPENLAICIYDYKKEPLGDVLNTDNPAVFETTAGLLKVCTADTALKTARML